MTEKPTDNTAETRDDTKTENYEITLKHDGIMTRGIVKRMMHSIIPLWNRAYKRDLYHAIREYVANYGLMEPETDIAEKIAMPLMMPSLMNCKTVEDVQRVIDMATLFVSGYHDGIEAAEDERHWPDA